MARNLSTILAIATTTEASARFPAEPASAGSARRFVGATLRQWRCDDLVDVATLLVSELVANAVLHAGTDIGVAVRLAGPRLRVEVSDGNPGTPARKHYSSLATTGRGLMLVERLSADWGVTPGPGGGKQVWFELDDTVSAADAGMSLFDFDLDDLTDAPLSGSGDKGRWGGPDQNPPGGDEPPPPARARVLCGAR